MTNSTNPFDLTIRICESMAFTLHSILGITEPFTGCLRQAFNDNGAMPPWCWPVAGILLAITAILNFSSNDHIIIGVQAYIATFHFGAMWYHVRLGHHPVTPIAPFLFVVFAFIVVSIRLSAWIALLGCIPCCILARILCWIMVTPPDAESLLIESDDEKDGNDVEEEQYLYQAS